MSTAYQQYQLQWMIDYGYSLQDFIEQIDDFANCEIQTAVEENDDISEINLSDCFDAFEKSNGFNGELWCCEDEWRDSPEYYSEQTLDANRANVMFMAHEMGTYRMLCECFAKKWGMEPQAFDAICQSEREFDD